MLAILNKPLNDGRLSHAHSRSHTYTCKVISDFSLLNGILPVYLLTYSRTHSLTHSLDCLFTQSLTKLLNLPNFKYSIVYETIIRALTER